MGRWASKLERANARFLKRFGTQVSIHLNESVREIEGIFNNPASLSQIAGGGYVADSEPELYVLQTDADGISQRDTLTVAGLTWIVTKPPEPDGTGMTKLILGRHDEQQSPTTSIQY
ncbi:hypothetical protein EA58_03820 [Photobacterium galatheae]|uniref:Uncharacterized protein n=2 Tax=Photobacterium galatheae TaxID=1654360 RepID=A0A066RZS4_9GAMM|nr:hypothetical protein EA58_03820 [Photobacterium galatheae]